MSCREVLQRNLSTQILWAQMKEEKREMRESLRKERKKTREDRRRAWERKEKRQNPKSECRERERESFQVPYATMPKRGEIYEAVERCKRKQNQEAWERGEAERSRREARPPQISRGRSTVSSRLYYCLCKEWGPVLAVLLSMRLRCLRHLKRCKKRPPEVQWEAQRPPAAKERQIPASQRQNRVPPKRKWVSSCLEFFVLWEF